MRILSVLLVIVMGAFLMGCAGTKSADSKAGPKSPAKMMVKDTRPRPLPAGIK